MKRFALTALLAMISLPLAAQQKAPHIVFESVTKDFGKVIQGQKLKHFFKFTNKGLTPLEIYKVESS